MDSRSGVNFFVPHAASAEQAERVWQSAREFQTEWSPTSRRVFSVRYMHDGRERTATVGERHWGVGEVVLVILESARCWLVCTENRGVFRDGPVLIGKPHAVVDFVALDTNI
jgi:hypothetical protein